MEIILLELILFVAFFIYAFAGFGAGLIAVPILALFYPLKTLSPFMNVIGLFSNIVLIKTYVKNVQYKVLLPLVIGNILGSIIGTQYLSVAQNVILLKILGVVVIISTIIIYLSDKRIALKPNVLFGFISGFLSGLLTALFATGGPPVILYLSAIFKDKKIFRSTILSFFLINGIFQAGFFAMNGILTQQVLFLFFISIPALLLGSWVGHRMHIKASEQVFRKAIFTILIVSGFVLLIK